MSYTMSAKVEEDYLMVLVSGEQNLEDNVRMITYIIETSQKYGIDKVVVDIRGLQGQPGTIPDFRLAQVAAGDAQGKIFAGQAPA